MNVSFVLKDNIGASWREMVHVLNLDTNEYKYQCLPKMLTL